MPAPPARRGRPGAAASRRPSRADGLGLAAVAALAAVLAAGLPAAVAVPMSGVAWVASAALAAWRCLRRPGRGVTGWRLLGAAAATWSAGCALWAGWYVARGAPPPFPSPADALLLAFPLLAAAGLLRLPGLPLSSTSRLRLLVDGASVTAAMVVLADLAGMAQPRGVAAGPSAGRIAFLMLDVLAACLGLLVIDRLRAGAFPAVRRAAAGVVVVVLADVTYSALASTTGYVAGGPLDALWSAGFLLLASGARLRSGAIDDPRPGTRLVPALPAAVAGVVLLLSGRLSSGLDPVLVVAVVLLGATLTLRQLLLGAENGALARSLEHKVGERTAALQDAVEQAHRDARTDPLTGLPNRLGFSEALAQALATASPQSRTAVVVLDLDRFQEVNDGLGHDVGDTVLQATARRLRDALRPGQLLARLGSDEFAVLLPGLHAGTDVDGVALRLVARLREPLPVGPVEVVVGASAGTAVRDAAPATRADRALAVRDVLRDADTALHTAKADGGGAVRAFDPAMHELVRRSLQVQVELRAALQDRALAVHYQPVVDLVADRVVGVEALARWTSPRHGPVPPPEFIAAAERSGLVVELERQVLDLACAQIVSWRQVWPSLTVAVNVSARHLREADFLDTVLSALARHRLPAPALVVEVTESLLFHDDEHVRVVLDRLHAAGVGLALDDFGTGYSSLSRLMRYPFDTLKVDRAFVSALDGPKGAPVLSATLALARGLGMRVVAEGVETQHQLSVLSRSGCELAQGYLLSRPGPADAVELVLGRRLLPAPRQPSRSDEPELR